MNIEKNVDLSGHSTMRLGGKASFFTKVSTRDELLQAVEWANQNSKKIIMIGSGSNIVWKDEGFDGLLIENSMLGYELQEIDDNTAMLTVGAGENWDAVVAKTVRQGYFTLAPLSLIPGRVGAVPVQNVGAYGQEVSNCILTIQAYDTDKKAIINLRGSDCEFGYRTSRFKTKDKHKFYITSVTFSLNKQNTLKPYYDALTTYASEQNIVLETPEAIRDAVIAIRSAKLPDPAKIANNGSFFANPVISRQNFTDIKDKYPNIKYWPLEGDSVKISAAWLLEEAGFKDYHDDATGMATWRYQPLVLVNESAKSTADLLAFKAKIVNKVLDKFKVQLIQEPETL